MRVKNMSISTETSKIVPLNRSAPRSGEANMSIALDYVPFVVVKCPSNGNASVLARWLAVATEADFLQTRLRHYDPVFDKAIQGLRSYYDVEFSPAAMAFARLWLNGGSAFSLSLFDSEWAEPFTYMAGAGFFTEIDDCYEMTHPRALTSDVIARGLLRLAATEDQNYALHPEWLLTTMTKQAARRTVKMIKRRAQVRPTIPLLQLPDLDVHSSHPHNT